MANIKSTTLSISFANWFKRTKLADFISDYRDAVVFYVNYLFNNKIHFVINDIKYEFDIKNDKLNLPKYLSTTNLIYLLFLLVPQ
jgi:hypothetical protein